VSDDASDGALRDALRDLIPDYVGPEDPLPRVVASVRRRRVRQRTLLAVSGAGLVVALALAAPAVLLTGHGGGVQSAAPYDPATRYEDLGVAVYPVAAGVVDGADWAIGSVALATDARRCLFSNDDVSTLEVTCFDDWKPGAAVTWNAQPLADKDLPVTRITGVAPAGTAAVRVRLDSGTPLTLDVRTTPTDPAARFFGDVLSGSVAVRDVTALDGEGTALGPPVPEPGYVCPDPIADCADPAN
jgi:hypothetical protein